MPRAHPLPAQALLNLPCQHTNHRNHGATAHLWNAGLLKPQAPVAPLPMAALALWLHLTSPSLPTLLPPCHPQPLLTQTEVLALAYGALNVLATVGIVIANKSVMLTFGFKYPVALTWCHSIVTAGEGVAVRLKMHEPRGLRRSSTCGGRGKGR